MAAFTGKLLCFGFDSAVRGFVKNNLVLKVLVALMVGKLSNKMGWLTGMQGFKAVFSPSER